MGGGGQGRNSALVWNQICLRLRDFPLSRAFPDKRAKGVLFYLLALNPSSPQAGINVYGTHVTQTPDLLPPATCKRGY